MNTIAFVIWLCFYPVCSAIADYTITLKYKTNGWPYFMSQKEGVRRNVINLVFYCLIAFYLFIKI